MKPASDSPASHQDIATQLRRRIVQGKLLPGAQLPTLRTIADTFSASPVTAQRALHQLRREGFIYSSGRLGTFVSARPPHLSRYALVFPVSAQQVRASRFWQSLAEAAAAVESQRPGTFHSAYDIGHHRQSEGFIDLLNRLETGGIAGIIFASNPHMVDGSALLTQPNVARAAIMTDSYDSVPNIPAVYDDIRSFITRALDYIAARGRKRLAIIGTPTPLTVNYDEMTQMAAKRGIEIRPHWIQVAGIQCLASARHATMLLTHSDLSPRPDSLLVLDDHFVDHVTQGIIATSTRVRPAQGIDLPAPDRHTHSIDVVALCHYANPPANPLGFAFLGFDADQMLAACVEQIVHQRRGEATTPLTLIPARFGFERQPESRIPAILEQLLSVEQP